jgi:hypothetical protein
MGYMHRPVWSGEPEWQVFSTDEFDMNSGEVSKKLYGFKDSSGKTVIEPFFTAGYDFREGLAAVRYEGKWGYIDSTYPQTGKFYIEPRFRRAYSFCEGLAKVEAYVGFGQRDWDRYEEYLLSSGRDLFKTYDEFREETKDRKVRVGYIDKSFAQTGKYFIDPVWFDGEDCSEGFIPLASVTGLWGIVDTESMEDELFIIEPMFQSVSRFSMGTASVKLNDKCGYISVDFPVSREYLVYPKYDLCMSYSRSGYALVGKNKKFGLINYLGREVLECECQVYFRLQPSS